MFFFFELKAEEFCWVKLG